MYIPHAFLQCQTPCVNTIIYATPNVASIARYSALSMCWASVVVHLIAFFMSDGAEYICIVLYISAAELFWHIYCLFSWLIHICFA